MNFLRKLLILFVLTTPLSKNAVWGQATTPKTDVTDAAAKAVLDRVKKQYEGYSSFESAFKVEIKLAEQAKPETYGGKIFQQGDNFRGEYGKDFIMSNGQILWQKVDNTVFIKNATGKNAGDIMTPKTLIRMYEKKEFIFGVTGEGAEGWSKKVTILTGKPTKNKEITKIVIAIDQKTGHIVSATAFDRNQMRTKFSLDPPVLNQKYKDALFIFDKSKYPGIKIVDLRD